MPGKNTKPDALKADGSAWVPNGADGYELPDVPYSPPTEGSEWHLYMGDVKIKS